VGIKSTSWKLIRGLAAEGAAFFRPTGWGCGTGGATTNYKSFFCFFFVHKKEDSFFLPSLTS
jgi:hypothetical protein